MVNVKAPIIILNSFHFSRSCNNTKSEISDFYFPLCRKEAGLEMEGHFLVRQVYEDVETYDLVGAASKVLGRWF